MFAPCDVHAVQGVLVAQQEAFAREQAHLRAEREGYLQQLSSELAAIKAASQVGGGAVRAVLCCAWLGWLAWAHRPGGGPGRGSGAVLSVLQRSRAATQSR